MKSFSLSLCGAFALAAAPAASAYTLTTYDLSLGGNYALADGQIHYSNGGQYKVFDLAGNTDVASFNAPTGFTGFDAFVAYDRGTGTAYMANSPDFGNARLYTFNYTTPTTGSWNSGSSNIYNGYSGAVHNSSLYFTGTKNAYNPISPDPNPNYISRFDSTSGERHLLIETGGWSAPLLVAGNGDIYYATTGLNQNALYRWSAQEVAGVDNSDDNAFLTLGENNRITDFAGGANGIAIDDAGNILFATSNYIAVLDINSADGYRILLDAQDLADLGVDISNLYIGYLAAAGDVLSNGTLYFSSEFMGNLLGVQVPEPSTYALLAAATALLITMRLRRRKA